MSSPDPSPQPPAAGDLRVMKLAPGVTMNFRYIPPTGPEGFRMGNRYDEDWAQTTEQPIHRVRIAQGFWLGETPVTRAQFAVWTAAVGEKHGNRLTSEDGGLLRDHPAGNLDWRQVVRFCVWLTQGMRSSRKLPAGVSLACLPTEAEWEYACRAGT